MGTIMYKGESYGGGGGGTNVVANPQGTPTDDLTSIQIGEDIYNISGGGGSAELRKTVLLSTPITTTGTYTLADDYTNYDFIAIQAGNGSSEADIHMYVVKEIISAMSNNLTVTNPNTGGWFNFTMNADELTITGMQLSTINSVVGYKVVGGGSGSGITTYEKTITTTQYGWWWVEDVNGNILDPTQHTLLSITPIVEYNTHGDVYYGASFFEYDDNQFDTSIQKGYLMDLQDINDGRFLRQSITIKVRVSYI